MLGSAAGMAAAGVPPAAIRAFSNATSDQAEPVCVRCHVSDVPGATAELLSDVLLSFGADSVVVEEQRHDGTPEQALFDVGSGLWDLCKVTAHFPLDHDVDGTLRLARDILALPAPLEARQLLVPSSEWVESIMASYVPLRVGGVPREVWIVPEGTPAPDPAAVNICLQPGVAFGTGEHPTTRLCLRALLRMDLTGAALVDYGTGSGVLAIAALLTGACVAVGTDVDPLAVRCAQRNAGLNGVGDRFAALACAPDADGADPIATAAAAMASGGGASGNPHVAAGALAALAHMPRSFDVVVANILQGPLLELRPRLAGYARPGGALILSGILQEQVAAVQEAYSSDFAGFQVDVDGSWAVVTAVKKP